MSDILCYIKNSKIEEILINYLNNDNNINKNC